MRNFTLGLVCTALLALTACADTEYPKWFSGEPTSEELAAYKGPIEMPKTGTEGKVWPNLADVPKRPDVILSEGEKNTLVAEMKNKNNQGLAEIAAYNAKVQPIAKSTKSKPIKKKKVKKKVSRHGQ